MNVPRLIASYLGYDLVRKRRRRHQHDTLAGHLSALFAKLDIDLVLDVGANVGQYAIKLRQEGYSGRILSFEPAPEPFAQLQEACQGDPWWEVVQVALGEASGVRKLNLTKGSQLHSFLTPNKFALELDVEGLDWEVTGTIEVPVRTLDEVIAESEASRVFLKLDTQGYDLTVLSGARASLPRILGLQSEVSVLATYEGMPDYVEALRTYKQMGFVPTAMFPVWRRDTLEVLEFDCVMRQGSERPR